MSDTSSPTGGEAFANFVGQIPDEVIASMPKTAAAAEAPPPRGPPPRGAATAQMPVQMAMPPRGPGGGGGPMMMMGPPRGPPMMMMGPPMMGGVPMMRGPPMMHMQNPHMMMPRGPGGVPMQMRGPRGGYRRVESGGGNRGGPRVELNLSTYLAPPGAPITLRWKFRAAELLRSDWVGLFHRDVQGSTRAMTTRDASYNSSSRVRGALSFRTPRAAGTYNFRYFRSHGANDIELGRTETLRVTMQWGEALTGGLKYIVSHLSDPANLISVGHQFARVVRQLEDFRSCIKSPAAEKDVSLVEAAYASVDELWNAVVDLVFYAFQFDTKQHEDAAAAVTAATAAAATAAAATVADVAAEAAAKDAPAEGAEAAAATGAAAAEAAAAVAATPSPNPRRGKSHTQNYIDVAAGVIYAIGDNVHAIGALDITRREELSEFQSRIRAAELKQTALRIVAQDRYV